MEKWEARERLSGPGKVIIKWVPGHTGITGNEAADNEAKTAAQQAANQHSAPATFAFRRREMKGKAKRDFENYWAAKAPKRYKELDIPLHKPKTEWTLPRYTLGKLLATRTGHGDFAWYYEKRGLTDAELHCTCGRRKTPEHFYTCRLALRAHTRRHRSALNIRDVLATSKGALEFHKWIQATSFYETIYPMHRRNA